MPRGRPKHPDILTPREWEVLALLREGLTNEQIGGRLGISENGAKYHVLEILSKLGVSSRYEAAAWRREPEGVSRRYAGLAAWIPWRSVSMSRMATLGLAVVVFGVMGLLAAGVLVMNQRSNASPPPPTLPAIALVTPTSAVEFDATASAIQPTTVVTPAVGIATSSPEEVETPPPTATATTSPVPATPQSGVFEVLIEAAVINSGGPEFAPSVAWFTAYADGAACVTANLAAISADVLLQLGLPDQPAACAQAGTTVTFRGANGILLMTEFSQEPGSRVTLSNFAIYPPHGEPSATPGGIPTPSAPSEPHCSQVYSIAGGQQVVLANTLKVLLPTGTFFVSVDSSRGIVTVCAPLANGVSMRYETRLALADCTEVGRALLDIADAAIVDAIASSCQLVS